jgi:hypothetical protein
LQLQINSLFLHTYLFMFIGEKMKIKNVFLSVFFAVISIGLVSCAKSEKDKVLEAQKLMLEWVKSDNFIPEMKANIKKPQDFEVFTEKKIKEIATKAGFKDMKEMETVSKKYEKDENFKQIAKQIDEAGKTKYPELMKLQMELMQQQQQQQMPQQEQIAPPATEEPKAK